MTMESGVMKTRRNANPVERDKKITNPIKNETMADKNNFSKQELNTLVAVTLVEVKEVKSGIDEIKKEIIMDKESRVNGSPKSEMK